MPSATLTSKGQVTIPKEVRDALAVGAGDVLDFRQEPDGTFRIQSRKGRLDDLAGILHAKVRRRVTLKEMDRAVAEGRRRGRG
jgi:antitoxin PrlF